MPIIIESPGAGGGSASAPLTLAGTDPVSAPEFSVVASPDQTAGTDFTNLTEVRDSNGNLLWATEFDGGVRQAWDIRVQEVGGPTVWAVARDGHTTWGNSLGVTTMEVNPNGPIIFAFSAGAGQKVMQMYADQDGLLNAIEVITAPDFDHANFAVTATGGVIATLPTADPHVVNELWNDGGAVKISAG